MADLRVRRPTTSLPVFLGAVIVVMVGVRLLYLGQPAGRDEAGFLLVGAGWDHGTSLYGAFWVDRPPLLIWIMELSGSLLALRLVGLAACILMVLGVARTAHLAAGDRAARWAAAAAALFSTAHWFGVPRTNGEMLASAFVAWGLALAAQALLRPDRRWWPAALGAGVMAACSVLIKQTIIDGAVFALVLAAAIAWQQPRRRRQAAAVVALAAVAFVVTIGLALAAAATRGTSVPDLFDALVTFRAEAGEVIRRSASSATTDRLLLLIGTWLAGGLAIIAALTAWHGLRGRDPVLLATLAVIAFVCGAALLGGSYWAHYLFQLVPASALAAGLLVDMVRPRVRVAVAAFTVIMTCGNVLWTVVSPPEDGALAETVGHWLRQSGDPSDTAVVAYGQPNVLTNADMTSPYPYLWSLPVRTRDSDLRVMSGVLSGPDRPTWFVDWSGIRSWGVDPTTAQTVLERHYRKVADVCGRTIWLERTQQRRLAPFPECP
ncbi:hypothetical protein [Aeromicrobium wangtongii]|uniref:Glycosyltransferase RgtA/B/C/D-like domain-containing protein n=1 Tax=Aeromicrobium wangtongii TaxID=2969247 RepID=A0ABY5M9I5_9ACTN|nr:hypothetical protein [Aeromicrobium wangtongii]MCD9197301.1 hypothetical protein [Aeromicrobium wangtongii]UUP14795.1 hypothetical protein NQV15_05655 [Aeromicrobium wangtongii]